MQQRDNKIKIVFITFHHFFVRIYELILPCVNPLPIFVFRLMQKVHKSKLQVDGLRRQLLGQFSTLRRTEMERKKKSSDIIKRFLRI